MREFTRVMWASDRARAVWEPRVQAIQRAWANVELESVRAGVRQVALVFDKPDLDWSNTGSDPVDPATPGRYVVCDNRRRDSYEALLAFHEAWHARDDRRVGELLGFPGCCRAFFDGVWNVDQKRDTTPSMRSVPAPAPEANILGRWLGVRLVPHLPCAFDCAETVAFARRLAPLWPREPLEWAQEMLSWPVRYSALHGVAIITWPVVRVVTNTDYTAHARDIALDGLRYPAEGPRGLVHPFQPPRRRPLALVRPSAEGACI